MSDETKSRITLEDVHQLDEDRWVEVVNGEIIEPDMSAASFRHVIVIDNLYDVINPFVKKHRLGRFLTDGLTYVLHADEEGTLHTRIPDCSFIRRADIPADLDLDSVFPGGPAVAVEVVSPTEGTQKTLAKVADYLRYGSEEVWVVYPIARTLHRYRKGEEVTVYTDTQTLIAESLFPGLEIRIADLFVMD